MVRLAVVPVQRHKPGFAGPQLRRAGRQFLMRSVFGFHITDEPFEDVATATGPLRVRSKPGSTLPSTMPHSPGTSASFSLFAFTVMSQVLVPMILTSVPGWMPAPMAPRCASNAPTATGVPTGKPVFFAHSAVNPPALESTGWTVGQPLAQSAEFRIEAGEEFLVRIAAPFFAVHRLMPGGAGCRRSFCRAPRCRSARRERSRQLDPGIGRVEHLGAVRRQCRILLKNHSLE